MIEFSFTFKGMDSSPAIAQYAEKKLAKLEKYFYGPVQVEVIFKREKFREIADIIFKGDGETIVVKEETEDIYSSIDLAYESLKKAIKKLKEKRQEHRLPRTQERSFIPEGEEVLVQVKKIYPLSTQEALELFKKDKENIFIFYNTDKNEICCLYREGDKIYLLIPEMR
ncbi:MAG: ribosome hibernation-promoting factor, HPF/YfiA family [Caldimicrobium sp.]